jgi:hypothetical protein
MESVSSAQHGEASACDATDVHADSPVATESDAQESSLEKAKEMYNKKEFDMDIAKQIASTPITLLDVLALPSYIRYYPKQNKAAIRKDCVVEKMAKLMISAGFVHCNPNALQVVLLKTKEHNGYYIKGYHADVAKYIVKYIQENFILHHGKTHLREEVQAYSPEKLLVVMKTVIDLNPEYETRLVDMAMRNAGTGLDGMKLLFAGIVDGTLSKLSRVDSTDDDADTEDTIMHDSETQPIVGSTADGAECVEDAASAGESSGVTPDHPSNVEMNEFTPLDTDNENVAYLKTLNPNFFEKVQETDRQFREAGLILDDKCFLTFMTHLAGAMRCFMHMVKDAPLEAGSTDTIHKLSALWNSTFFPAHSAERNSLYVDPQYLKEHHVQNRLVVYDKPTDVRLGAVRNVKDYAVFLSEPTCKSHYMNLLQSFFEMKQSYVIHYTGNDWGTYHLILSSDACT